MAESSLNYVSKKQVLSITQGNDDNTVEVVSLAVVKQKTQFKDGKSREIMIEKEKLCYGFPMSPEKFDADIHLDQFDDSDSNKRILISKKKIEKMVNIINKYKGIYTHFGLDEKVREKDRAGVEMLLEVMKKQGWKVKSKIATVDLTQEFKYQDNQSYKDMIDIFFTPNCEKGGFGLSILLKRKNTTTGGLMENKSTLLKVSELDALFEWMFGGVGTTCNLHKYFPTLKDTVQPLIVNEEGQVEEVVSEEKYLKGNYTLLDLKTYFFYMFDRD